MVALLLVFGLLFVSEWHCVYIAVLVYMCSGGLCVCLHVLCVFSVIVGV